MVDMMEIRLEGGEFALPVEIGGEMEKANRGWWPATRQGEKTRTCERCGNEYVPNSRNQKYCDDCKTRRVR